MALEGLRAPLSSAHAVVPQHGWYRTVTDSLGTWSATNGTQWYNGDLPSVVRSGERTGGANTITTKYGGENLVSEEHSDSTFSLHLQVNCSVRANCGTDPNRIIYSGPLKTGYSDTNSDAIETVSVNLVRR